MQTKPTTLRQFISLTAIWAFSESGLGGILHAFKFPFTGFIVGGFACTILILMARISPGQILSATLTVIAIKFTISPHSPIPAYLAVGFQGALAWLVFRFIKPNLVTSVLFGGLALLESAVQKFLITTLLFGKSVWEALDVFSTSVLKEVGVFAEFSFSFWLILTYCLIYLTWGLFIGFWAFNLYSNLEKFSHTFSLREVIIERGETKTDSKKNKSFRFLIKTAATLFFIGTVFLVSEGSISKLTYTLIRTVSVLLFVYLLAFPLGNLILKKISGRMQNQNMFALVLNEMTPVKSNAAKAWLLSSYQRGTIFRLLFFVKVLLASGLFPDPEIQENE